MAQGVLPDARVTALRQRLGMTQEEFAHTLGVTVSTVNRWENGKVVPSRLARRAMDSVAVTLEESAEHELASLPAEVP